MTRAVKLGRKLLSVPAGFHWAVKVGNTWYEIAIDGGKKAKRTKVNRNRGSSASSGAGSLGGELAGETDKTDDQIDQWIESWIRAHPDYGLTAANCQKFAWEFMDWLTDGNFICPHKFDAADYKGLVDNFGVHTFARAEDGNAIARFSLGKTGREMSGGIISAGGRFTEAKVQAVAGPGLGVWADASLCRLEGSIGNIVGMHIDPNVNTGAGIRNGNLDVHVLGFGGSIGADGVSWDSPLGGVSACSIM